MKQRKAPSGAYVQIDGDVDPLQHDGLFARTSDDGTIELYRVQNVINNVGVREAADVGATFWTSELALTPSDLTWDGFGSEMASAYCIERDEWEGMTPMQQVSCADGVLPFDELGPTDELPGFLYYHNGRKVTKREVRAQAADDRRARKMGRRW